MGTFSGQSLAVWEIVCIFAVEESGVSMSYTEKIIIKNPSRELEERIRKVGVQKYLWIEELCSDEVKPDKII